MYKLMLATLIVSVFGQISNYGNYCGTENKQTDGRMPIDDLDRACQIHDICVDARGDADCHCNTQLYCAANPDSWPYNASSAYLEERDEIIAAMESATLSCGYISCGWGTDGFATFALSDRYGYNYIPFFGEIGTILQRVTALGPGIVFYYTDRTTNLTDEIPERLASAEAVSPYELVCCYHHVTLMIVSTANLYGHSNYVDINGGQYCVWEIAENGTLTERYLIRECANGSSDALRSALSLGCLMIAILFSLARRQ